MLEASGTVHGRVLETAARYPDSVAVIGEDAQLRYAELVRRAESLARLLVARGVRPEEPVGLLVTRSSQTVVGALAILLTGGCYAPMHERLPAARVQSLVELTGIRTILCAADDERAGDLRQVETIALDPTSSVAAGSPRPLAVHPEALAYVSFTSGTTGVPKGVCVPHSCVVSYLDGAVDRLGFVPGWQHLLVPSIAFDLSVSVVWGALFSGGTIHIPPEEVVFDPDELAAYVRRWRIDAVKLTPSHLAQLPEGAGIERLRSVFVGGEAPDPQVLLWWSKALAGQLYAGYGTTESTGATTLSPVVPSSGVGPLRRIGDTLPRCAVTALSPSGSIAAPGTRGELLVQGAGITRGYYGDPRLTAQKFVPDPGTPGRRAYRTGDAVEVMSLGVFEFRGRIDAQINLNGYRVEPGEVEEVLERHPSVRRAMVLEIDGTLVAAVDTGDDQPDRRQLRTFALSLLPPYVVPSVFVRVVPMPLGANGKVDRQAVSRLAVHARLSVQA